MGIFQADFFKVIYNMISITFFLNEKCLHKYIIFSWGRYGIQTNNLIKNLNVIFSWENTIIWILELRI